MSPTRWHMIPLPDLEQGQVTTIVIADRALAITRNPGGWSVLDNRCPHQGGPLGDGEIDPERGYLLCPWHGYGYDAMTGEPPPGFTDSATCYPTEVRDDGIYVELPDPPLRTTISDQMVDVMTDWGVDTVFGMVGHSNLGMADALRKAEEKGKLRYIGIRHEGAASFAASAYGKLTGRPAACFSIAGPGATNLLTGLWDAKVDRAPILALTGQVQTQVLGPGAFQEIDLASAFASVAAWSQTVLKQENATELMALALKHAIVRRDVGHLILPDEVQELGAAVRLLEGANHPIIVMGRGSAGFQTQIIALAEKIDAPLITTFKAKGLVADDHPLACGVVGRSGTPIPAAMMARADAMLVLGASFSNHSGLASWVPTIQVDSDRMALGKFSPVDIPVWGDIGVTVELLSDRLPPTDRPEIRSDIDLRWRTWRIEKAGRAGETDDMGRIHPAAVFEVLSELAPEDAAIAVDVGNNTYAFGHYFETKAQQDVVMSGYLGSIGFGFPAAMGLWAATRDTNRKVISISGDGGFGQYMAEFTTAVKYRMPITHVLLDNAELGKISREQIGAIRPVWETSLVNPDFSEYARICGGRGFHVRERSQLRDMLGEALNISTGPSLVVVDGMAHAI